MSTKLSRKFRFFQTGIPVTGNEEDNLVIKAFKLVSAGREIPGTDIYLLKRSLSEQDWEEDRRMLLSCYDC